MAANPFAHTGELQFSTENTAEETTVRGSGRITSATSDGLMKYSGAASCRKGLKPDAHGTDASALSVLRFRHHHLRGI